MGGGRQMCKYMEVANVCGVTVVHLGLGMIASALHI